jgi:hypothetical protein
VILPAPAAHSGDEHCRGARSIVTSSAAACDPASL